MDILIGCILGDAYVSPQGKIQLEQSVAQKEYLEWKFEELSSISYRGTPRKVERRDKRTGKLYESVRFWTRQYFRPLRERFYQDGRKIFPPNLLLSPLTVAVWHMDDGHYDHKKHRCTLATDNFSRAEIVIIQSLFRRFFSVNSVARPNGKLVFAGENCSQFLKIVKPYVVPSMGYKIR